MPTEQLALFAKSKTIVCAGCGRKLEAGDVCVRNDFGDWCAECEDQAYAWPGR